MNWSNSPKSSVVFSWIGVVVTLVPFAWTIAERFAFGTGIDARSVVRFCKSCCSVELRLFVERSLMSESRSDVEMF